MMRLSECLTEMATALGIADGCPEHTCTNVEPPRDAVPCGDGFMASYLCRDCGTAWARSYTIKES